MADKDGRTGECVCGHDEGDHYISGYGISHECEVDDCQCRVYEEAEIHVVSEFESHKTLY